MEGVCFRRLVIGLRIGGRKCNEDVWKGILITGINAKIEILKRILPRILEIWLKLNPNFGLQYTLGGTK